MLFYPTWSLKTHMVNNSMQQEEIRHHQALLEKKNSGSLCPTNLKVVCLFISGDCPMFSLFYSTLSGKDKEAKVTIATFGNILQQSLQECRVLFVNPMILSGTELLRLLLHSLTLTNFTAKRDRKFVCKSGLSALIIHIDIITRIIYAAIYK